MMFTFREFLLTENAESEKKRAYTAGVADAKAGRPKKNASDLYGPYGGRYDAGYYDMTKKDTK